MNGGRGYLLFEVMGAKGKGWKWKGRAVSEGGVGEIMEFDGR